MPVTDLKIKANLVLPTPQNLTSEGDVWTTYLKNLQSKGHSFRIYPQDLKSQADLVPVWWRDIKVQGNVEAAFIPPRAILEKSDHRNESFSHPIARIKTVFVVPAGNEKYYSSIGFFNAMIRQIIIKIPGLDGATIKYQLLDEEGTVLYESSDLTENQTVVTLLTADTEVPLVGKPSIGLIFSAVQNSVKNFVITLYGR